DGIGTEIWKEASRVIAADIEKAYAGEKKIDWKEVLAGQKAYDQTGEWLPAATLDTIKEYLIEIKGPFTTPIGRGIRSLNVAQSQELNLFNCLRPVSWFKG
ncbi:isocitrate/isopropylmalate family dehydrogenase, partial [Staphylococcus pseudintermedius]|uniref:isocitrate/isopropylmalate family dehydrogenase n=1 Tax=Staphylococcus pseudintermedius TaxID=283734 RepID=UPI000E38B96C